jgi:hypothetical protein
MADQKGSNGGGEGTVPVRGNRPRGKRTTRSRARGTTNNRVGTGIGTGAVGAGMNFNPMQKAAGSELAHLVYGFSLGRGIAPKQALGYLNSIAVTW